MRSAVATNAQHCHARSRSRRLTPLSTLHSPLSFCGGWGENADRFTAAKRYEPQFFKREQWKFKPQLCYPVSGLRPLEPPPDRCLKTKKEVRLAISYSPGGSPPKYHQRIRPWLPGSECFRVYPRSYGHQLHFLFVYLVQYVFLTACYQAQVSSSSGRLPCSLHHAKAFDH